MEAVGYVLGEDEGQYDCVALRGLGAGEDEREVLEGDGLLGGGEEVGGDEVAGLVAQESFYDLSDACARVFFLEQFEQQFLRLRSSQLHCEHVGQLQIQ